MKFFTDSLAARRVDPFYRVKPGSFQWTASIFLTGVSSSRASARAGSPRRRRRAPSGSSWTRSRPLPQGSSSPAGRPTRGSSDACRSTCPGDGEGAPRRGFRAESRAGKAMEVKAAVAEDKRRGSGNPLIDPQVGRPDKDRKLVGRSCPRLAIRPRLHRTDRGRGLVSVKRSKGLCRGERGEDQPLMAREKAGRRSGLLVGRAKGSPRDALPQRAMLLQPVRRGEDGKGS
jgi:hypothetical protein